MKRLTHPTSQDDCRPEDTLHRQELEPPSERQDTTSPIEYPRQEELGVEVQEAGAGYFIGQEGQRNATPVPVPRPYEGTAWTDTLEHPDPDQSVDTQALNQLPQDVAPSGHSWDPEREQRTTTASRSEGLSLVDFDPGNAGPSLSHRANHPPRRPRSHRGNYTCDHPSCATSTATWSTLASLRQHQRTHIPYHERPYWCAICPDQPRFLYRKDLRRHWRHRVHMVPNVQCPDCGGLFPREDLMRRHQRSCHEGADWDRVA